MLTIPIISNPLLLLMLLLPLTSVPLRPPPSRPSHAEVNNSDRQNNNRVSSIVRRILGKIESQPTVNHAEQEDCRDQVAVDFGEHRGGFRLLIGAVVEEAEAELEEHCDED